MISEQITTPAEYAASMQHLLEADVQVLAPARSALRRLQHLETPTVSLMSSSGDAMTVSNGASASADVYVVRMLRGATEVRCGDRRIAVGQGAMIAFQGRRAVDLAFGQPFDVIGTRLPASALAAWLPRWKSMEFSPIGDDVAEARLFVRMAGDLLEAGASLQARTSEVMSSAMARLLALSLGLHTPAGAGKVSGRTEFQRRRVQDFVSRNLTAQELSVRMIASGVGLSVADLHRLFEAETMTLTQWIQSERLRAGREAIEADVFRSRTLTDIGLSVGFRDSAHFSRSFRRRFGITPTNYRASLPPTRESTALASV